MERPGGSSLQTILDLFGVRGRSFSDPHASTSNHDVACHPLAGWWKPSDGYANLTLLLLPICERCRERCLILVTLVREASSCGSDDEHCHHDPNKNRAQTEQQGPFKGWKEQRQHGGCCIDGGVQQD